ncbi:MAG TPA: hypothetical protein VF345_00380 [Chthoniobacterales bacterium]
MTSRRTLIVTVFCWIAVVAVGGWAVLQHVAVPYRGFEAAGSSALWRSDGYSTIPPDAKILRLIQRAKLDFLIAPIQGLRGEIVFNEARAHGKEVYLLFQPMAASDTVVVYCGTPDDGRLHWKMILGLNA